MSKHKIAKAVQAGLLIAVRRGQYLPSNASEIDVRAARLGGRLDCLSLLVQAGVFVKDRPDLHLQITPHSSRQPKVPKGVVRHWRATESGADDLRVPLIEALAQSVRCQNPRDAIATLDNAAHLGILDDDGMVAVFDQLPDRFRVLRGMVDRRSESGPESLVRLMARGLGFRVRVQVEHADVGRVDLELDGWLVVECDSQAHHSDWDQQLVDYRRDLTLAAQGYCVLRLVAEDIMYRPEVVLEALRGLRLRHAGGPNSVRSSARRATGRRAGIRD